VDHASFAALLTMPEWTDRLLGQSRSISLVNDRLWLLNGTNVSPVRTSKWCRSAEPELA